MKSVIECFIGLSSEVYEAMCREATLVFDANVLLNLYRYSNNTREHFISLLRKLSDRVWLPHQVAFEFGRNRSKVIIETVEKYKAVSDEAKKFIDRIRNDLRLGTSDTEINDLNRSLETWITNYRDSNLKVSTVDDDKFVLPFLLEIFEGKVGEKYDSQKIVEIEKEGNNRYDKGIPPGYKDKTKTNGNEYGDLIIWNQLIDYAKVNGCDIVFVTGDTKEDWWENVHGRTTGPRSELRREFAELTNKQFHMYSMERFIEVFSAMQGKTVQQEIIEEVMKISEFEIKALSMNHQNNADYKNKIKMRLDHIMLEIEARNKYVDALIAKYGKMSAMPQNVIHIFMNTNKRIAELEHEREKICRDIDNKSNELVV